MNFKKFEEVQKDLQSIADQVGETRFAHAKMLYLEGVVVTDAEGNPLAPEQLKYEVMLSPAAAETDAADPTDEMPKEEEPAKALRETVKSAIAAAHSLPQRVVVGRWCSSKREPATITFTTEATSYPTARSC